jgi:hypothetical protein
MSNSLIKPLGSTTLNLSQGSGGATTIPSTATGGLQLYNTADQTTNYERLELLWSSNVGILQTASGGSGSARELRLNANSVLRLRSRGGVDTSCIIADAAAAFTATSGTINVFQITPTYNQASGTAANTDLLVNRTETAVGSGAQNLMDLQVGAASRFSVSSIGGTRTALAGRGVGHKIYNTADETTNYERVELLWNSNIAYLQTAKGGSGTARSLAIGVDAAAITIDSTLLSTFSGAIRAVNLATASAPAYAKGVIYFDTTLNKLRVGGASAFETITSV